ncbi:hypothetical protein LCGC14_2352460 [marine sediment metagenome]|uniref:Uncharacterized protein n=1 Tax=marine sediment metagenome TaxID=412755 RepID=A0A0F9C9E7_9ZZZZ
MKTYKIKKLFLGHASIRSHIVKKQLDKNEGIVIDYNERKMTLSYEQLKKGKQLTREEFQSKFNDKVYELYDFIFVPDEMNKEIIKMRNVSKDIKDKKLQLETDLRFFLKKFSEETGLIAKVIQEPVYAYGEKDPIGYLVTVEVKV